MEKVKRIVLYILILIIIGFLFMYQAQLYFSQENLHRANEKGLHYGPSEKILYCDKGEGINGKGLVISKAGDEGLSVTATKKKFGFLYGLSNSGIGFVPCEKVVNIYYVRETDTLFGMAYNDRADSVVVYFSEPDKGDGLPLQLDSDGFFYCDNLTEKLLANNIPTEDYLKWSKSDFYFFKPPLYSAILAHKNYICGDSLQQRGTIAAGDCEANPNNPLDWKPLLNAERGDLNAEVINYLNSCFRESCTFEIQDEQSANTKLNPNAAYCLFNSDFDLPEEVQLAEILKYFPVKYEADPELEKAILETSDFQRMYPDAECFAGIPTPVNIFKGSEVREMLSYYLDIEIEDLHKTDCSYLPEYDIFWNYVSDYGPGMFYVTSGQKFGKDVYLYWDTPYWRKTLTLDEVDGRYVIKSLRTTGSTCFDWREK